VWNYEPTVSIVGGRPRRCWKEDFEAGMCSKANEIEGVCWCFMHYLHSMHKTSE
jgi:hypothetical protein